MILWKSIILFMSYVEFFRIWLKMVCLCIDPNIDVYNPSTCYPYLNVLYTVLHLKSMIYIKTHDSELRGQEEAACMRIFWPTQPLQ